ncbi:MAG: YdgA family protein, partial [Burkholderiales bacterium]|nr:YdgA family protein [Burkholderiales bacterium]
MLKRILRIKLIIGITLIIGLVLTHLITAYVFGKKAEEVLNLQFKTMTNSPYIVVDHYAYKRGLFSSEISAHLSLNSYGISNIIKLLPNINESEINKHNYYIQYTTHVTNGLFAGVLDGEFSPTIAVANTNIKYPASLSALLGKFFGSKSPLYIKDIINFNKSGSFVISSPSFDYEEALSGVQIVWKGMSLITKYNPEFTKFNNQLSIPNFQLHAPNKSDIAIDNLKYISNSEYSKNKVKVGNTDLSLNQIMVSLSSMSNSNFRLGDLLNMLTGISIADFLNELDAVNPMNFKLTKITYNAKSIDTDGFFNSQALVNFESLVTESKIYGPLKLDVAVSHVLSNEFSHMIDQLT